MAKTAIGPTQLFNILVAQNLAQKQVGVGRSTRLSSIRVELRSQELIKFIDVAKYAGPRKRRSV